MFCDYFNFAGFSFNFVLLLLAAKQAQTILLIFNRVPTQFWFLIYRDLVVYVVSFSLIFNLYTRVKL